MSAIRWKVEDDDGVAVVTTVIDGHETVSRIGGDQGTAMVAAYAAEGKLGTWFAF